MVWCPMILAQYVIVRRVVGGGLDPTARAGIVRHFEVTRTPDGAWGLHREAGGYVFVTTLAYVALRLLGLDRDDPLPAAARRWLRAQPGGVLAVPTWGKFWLALLDLYGWEGVSPCPPELCLLPEWFPVHPRRFYCHTRQIYLAMAYLYGRRARASLGPIVAALREELYGIPYEAIDFRAHSRAVAPTDRYVRPGLPLRLASAALRAYERVHAPGLRQRALERCFDRILYEQRTTRYEALSPVNGLLDCLAIWARSPEHPDLAPSLEGLERWRWEDQAEGIRYVGARSQTWDTAFAIQAILDSPAAARAGVALRRAYRFLLDAQLTEELPDHRAAQRDAAVGGWCFSDGRHRWPVSDCTAEAVCALLGLHAAPGLAPPPAERIAPERLRQAAGFILSRQNADGGFGTYERRRGSERLEAFNASEMFGRCMTERSYVECTGSALRALVRLRAAEPALRGPRLDTAIERGVRFLRSRQRGDGSVPGFWGIHFTYALFHFVAGLRAAGVPPADPALVRAAEWLVRAQHADGGWGEHYSGCLDDRYVAHPESQVVMTSWALLALLEVLGAGADPVARGVSWLAAQQRPDGSWPPGAVNGVFFGSAMLDYRLYKSYFPAWALGRYARLAGAPLPRPGG